MSGSGHSGVMFPQKAGRLPAGVPYTAAYQQQPVQGYGQPPPATGVHQTYHTSTAFSQAPAATGYGRAPPQPQQQAYRPALPGTYAPPGTQPPQHAPPLSQPMHPQAHPHQAYHGAVHGAAPLAAPLAPQQAMPTGYGNAPRPVGHVGHQPAFSNGHVRPQPPQHVRPPVQYPPPHHTLQYAGAPPAPAAANYPQQPPSHHPQNYPHQPHTSIQQMPHLQSTTGPVHAVQQRPQHSTNIPGAPSQSHGQVMRPLTAGVAYTQQGAGGRGAGGRGRGGSGGGEAWRAGGERPAKKSRREREFDAAAALPQGPVVVRQPATEAERQEVEKWKAERRASFPSAANLQRKAADAAARREAGALDPARQERLAKLREVVALQRSMGVDHIAGTTDLLIGGSQGSWSPRGGHGYGGGYGHGGGGGRGGRGGRMGPSGPGAGRYAHGAHGGLQGDMPAGEQQQGGEGRGGQGAAEQDKDVGHEVAGGIATRYQWVRHGYVPPVESPKPASATNGTHQHGYQNHQSHQQPQYIPRPRKPTLLHRLLDKDIRRDRSWILQALRFLVRNNFLQPSSTAAGSAASASDGPQVGLNNDGQPCAAEGSTQQQGLASAAGHVQDIDWPPEAPEPVSLEQLLPPPPADDEDEAAAATGTAVGADTLQGPSVDGEVADDGFIPMFEGDVQMHEDHIDGSDVDEGEGEQEGEGEEVNDWEEGEGEEEGESSEEGEEEMQDGEEHGMVAD